VGLCFTNEYTNLKKHKLTTNKNSKTLTIETFDLFFTQNFVQFRLLKNKMTLVPISMVNFHQITPHLIDDLKYFQLLS
jgi:hypothetical protein